MFGKILSTVIKTATLPVTTINATLDIATGGDGSKKSRLDVPTPFALIEEVSDAIAKEAEKIDD